MEDAAQPRLDEWRETLKEILADDAENRRIIRESKISTMSLGRWVKGTATPGKAYLLKLIETVPAISQNKLFTQLQQAGLLKEGDIEAPPLPVEEPIGIPAEFYDQVARTVGATSESLRSWTICQLVHRQCSAQLLASAEPNSLMITILTCTPPLGPHDPVRSLRELIYFQPDNHQGSEESKVVLNTRFLLGAESLAGQVCTTLQGEAEQPLELESTQSFQHILPGARSAAACPLLRSGLVGGCLLLLSQQEQFFTPKRMRLIQSYASLAALAFKDEAFYALAQLSLAIMPPPAQQTIVASVRQRIISLMRQAGPVATSQQDAERLAWHHIEDEQIKQAQQTSL